MKITKERLNKIIKEETDAVLSEKRGFLRKLFRMQNPNLNKYLKAYEMAIKTIKRKYENLDSNAVAGGRGSDNTVDQYEALLSDLDMARDAFQTYQDESGFDANQDQRELGRELAKNDKNLRQSIRASADEISAASYRSPVLMKHERENEERRRRWAREKEEEEARGPAYGSGSSRRGSAYDKFGQKWQDRNVVDISRLEETIAEALKEVLKEKH